jgi:hypothetical protein
VGPGVRQEDMMGRGNGSRRGDLLPPSEKEDKCPGNLGNPVFLSPLLAPPHPSDCS